LQKSFDLEGNLLPSAISVGLRTISRTNLIRHRFFQSSTPLVRLLQPWEKDGANVSIFRSLSESERAKLAPRIQKWSDSIHWATTSTYSGLSLSPLVFDQLLQNEATKRHRTVFSVECTLYYYSNLFLSYFMRFFLVADFLNDANEGPVFSQQTFRLPHKSDRVELNLSVYKTYSPDLGASNPILMVRILSAYHFDIASEISIQNYPFLLSYC
jgi:hypothetical protein